MPRLCRSRMSRISSGLPEALVSWRVFCADWTACSNVAAAPRLPPAPPPMAVVSIGIVVPSLA